jgi:hypothetical protein
MLYAHSMIVAHILAQYMTYHDGKEYTSNITTKVVA